MIFFLLFPVNTNDDCGKPCSPTLPVGRGRQSRSRERPPPQAQLRQRASRSRSPRRNLRDMCREMSADRSERQSRAKERQDRSPREYRRSRSPVSHNPVMNRPSRSPSRRQSRRKARLRDEERSHSRSRSALRGSTYLEGESCCSHNQACPRSSNRERCQSRSREQSRSNSRDRHRSRSRDHHQSSSRDRHQFNSRHSSCRDYHQSRLRGRTTDTSESPTAFSKDNFMQLLEAFKAVSRPDSLDKFSNMQNAIPEFHPARKEQTMTMWLHKVNECASIYGWTEKQVIHFALPKLRGVAQRWYEGLSSVLFSWEEWQGKLRAAFPSQENYGQMLSDMLAKRARFGESLEDYYYEKLALINRCEIKGSRAVECLLHGIDDRSVRLGAEAVQYDDPDKLLAYLRNARNIKPQSDKRYYKNNTRAEDNTSKTYNRGQRCYNCKQDGHTVLRCPQPIKRCGNCNKIGHDSETCFSKQAKPNGKTVMTVLDGSSPEQKYFKVTKVNGVPFEAFIDFGSECCMVRMSDFYKIDHSFDVEELPTLRGFGNSVVQVLGKRQVCVSVDGVEAQIELLVVPDNAMHVPLMIGQTFTEQAHIVVHKTSEKLQFLTAFDAVTYNSKVDLFCTNDITLANGVSIVEVHTDSSVQGEVYVEGGLRVIADVVFSVPSGLYSVREGGIGELVVNIPADKTVTLTKNYLLARGRVAKEEDPVLHTNVMKVTKSDNKVTRISDADVCVGDGILPSERKQLLTLLNNYRECFAFDMSELGVTSVGEMSIALDDNEPVVYRPYRLAFREKEVVRDMISELLANGIVRPSTSPYASPIVLVRKKTGEYRLCIDYRALNKKTIRENYPMPLIDDQLDLLAGHKFYTTLDLASGYYQIPVREDDKYKTAFVTPDGHFEFNRMPFGLANAPATFQRIMNQVLGSARHKEALAYLDDVIIPAKNFSEGLCRLENILKMFSSAGLTLKLTKCLFFGHNVDYLGFEVSEDGIRPGSKKIEAVEKFPIPQNQHNVRQFLGLASFFRRFVPGFSIIAKPLTCLLKKDAAWVWGTEQLSAFKTLQLELIQKPTLALYDPQAETELHTDACKIGLAGILLQRGENGILRPVAYFSRQTTPEEQNYSSYDLETLAVVSALQKFRVYLVGVSFKIVTDCNSLRATFQKRDMVPRVARWWERMQEFNFSIIYRAGTAMTHVDALSRNPVPDSPKPINVNSVSEENWLTTVQNTDSEIQRIVRTLRDPNLNDAVDIKGNYKLKGDKLFRITSDGDRWVVPKGVRWQIVKLNHDDIGHFSVDKTLEKVKSCYWFPKMRTFVKKYVTSCLECAYSKSSGGKKPGFLHPIEKVDNPFDTIHLDHVGPFVRSSRGNIHILAIIDAYTRYLYLKPVRNTKSTTTIKILQEYFAVFGVPRRLISDRGTSFTSTVFKKFIEEKGIKHILNAVATPRANGQVERYNKIVVDALTAKSIGTPDSRWDDHLPEVQWGINNTFNKGINCTPSEALFGIRPVGSNESRIMSELAKTNPEYTSKNNRMEIRQKINAHIDVSQQKQKEAFDKHRCRPTDFRIGDLVRIERQVPATGQSKKLVPKFQGPYKITAVFDHDRFQVEDTPITRKGGRRFSTTVAIDKMKPWLNFSRPHENEMESSSDYNEEDE